MDTFLKLNHMKTILAAFPFFAAVLLSGCGSGCMTLGGPTPTTCGTATSSTSSSSSTFSISGTVSGAAPQGVTISLTGAGTGTTTTDVNGNYSFAALPNGSYNVVPSASGNAFAPVSTAATISGADVTAINFTETANAAATSGISGTVSGPVKQNVLITLTLNGTDTGTAVTDANGSYSFTVLPNGTYTVTPTLTGYTFTPAGTTTAPIGGGTATGINFTEAATP